VRPGRVRLGMNYWVENLRSTAPPVAFLNRRFETYYMKPCIADCLQPMIFYPGRRVLFWAVFVFRDTE